jgi:hypothetical protein
MGDTMRMVMAVVLASVLSSVLTAGFVTNKTEASEFGIGESDEPDSSAALVASFEAGLARLEALMPQASDLVGAPARITERSPVNSSEDDRLDALTALVEGLRVDVQALGRRPTPMTGTAVPVDRGAPIDQRAIGAMIDLAAVEPNSVGDELKLLTIDEVIGRFGFPTRAEAANSDAYDMWMSWDEPHVGALDVYVTGGYVTYAGAKGPPGD